jgi:formyl-CoA transferase
MPLAGLKVLDLTVARAGPVAVRQLADWGADVIQVVAPWKGSNVLGGTPEDGDYQNLHRNKRALRLDLKSAKGRDLLLRLADTADVVVENFRPGVKHRLKIDHEVMEARNPRLIYASISGFGQTGPYIDRPAVDQIIQGMGGLMSVTGRPGDPPLRAGLAVSDVLAGLYLAQAIFIALIERNTSGRGQWVQTSLLESLLACMDFQAARVLVDDVTPKATGNGHPVVAMMATFEARDGMVNIGAGGTGMFRKLCKILGAEDLAGNPDYADEAGRSRHRQALVAAIERHTKALTRAELVERLNAAGIPCGPVYDLAEALADPQVRHVGLAWPYEHATRGPRALVGQPFHLTRTPHQGVRAPAPLPGQDTDDVLQELGLDPAEIGELRNEGVI